jgi:tRNA1Val (adenine37-N6)-methyltransferase
MANTYFQFKQFRVTQERGAMKVCTDACLQGAYAADYLLKHIKDFPWGNDKPLRVLDLGTGTGLLTLMLSQALPEAIFDAIELEKEACIQARENFIASPWKDRIHLLEADIRGYHSLARYPFVVSNPPFYQQQLKSPEEAKNGAKHDSTLRHDQLLDTVIRQLDNEGLFCVMIPASAFAPFASQAYIRGLYPVHILWVSQAERHDPFRCIAFFRRRADKMQEDTFRITGEAGQYSPSFQALLRPYYLDL